MGKKSKTEKGAMRSAKAVSHAKAAAKEDSALGYSGTAPDKGVFLVLPFLRGF